MKTWHWAIFLLICSCSSHSDWELSAIPAGEKSFDSSRLCYHSQDRLSGISLDLFFSGNELSGYLTTTSRRFGPSPINASIRFSAQTLEIPLLVHEGQMRIRLPDELLNKIIAALLNGETVTMVIGSLEQKFQGNDFKDQFQKLTQKKTDLLGLML